MRVPHFSRTLREVGIGEMKVDAVYPNAWNSFQNSGQGKLGPPHT
jgi:hypothetical protein